MSIYRHMNGRIEEWASRSGRPLKIAQLAPLYESVPPSSMAAPNGSCHI
jgi:hypothetical protein